VERSRGPINKPTSILSPKVQQNGILSIKSQYVKLCLAVAIGRLLQSFLWSNTENLSACHEKATAVNDPKYSCNCETLIKQKACFKNLNNINQGLDIRTSVFQDARHIKTETSH
jgi:hypothetical protein